MYNRILQVDRATRPNTLQRPHLFLTTTVAKSPRRDPGVSGTVISDWLSFQPPGKKSLYVDVLRVSLLRDQEFFGWTS